MPTWKHCGIVFPWQDFYGGLTLAAPSIRHDMHGGAPRDGHGIYSASRVSASQMFGVYNAFSGFLFEYLFVMEYYIY